MYENIAYTIQIVYIWALKAYENTFFVYNKRPYGTSLVLTKPYTSVLLKINDFDQLNGWKFWHWIEQKANKFFSENFSKT